jgi:hypothetical protein
MRINNKWWRASNAESRNEYAIIAASRRHDIRLGWEFDLVFLGCPAADCGRAFFITFVAFFHRLLFCSCKINKGVVSLTY